MFDLRYHVISLAAVFLALILGILVGVAISDPDLANRTELALQRDKIAALNDRLEAAADRSEQRDAAERFVDSAYPAVMHDRLAGKRIVVVFVGPVDGAVANAVRRAATDAGAAAPPVRALATPLRADAVAAVLGRRPALAGYRGENHLADLGRDLGRELVEGGQMPLWDALETSLVEYRDGSVGRADAVVVVRTAKPQGGDTGRFLRGLYEGLRADAPVVGVEAASAEPSAVPTFRAAGFSTVRSVDTALGRVALAVLLGGGASGQFGLQEDGKVQLPPITPVEPVPVAVADPLTVLVAARDEEERIARTVAALRAAFPEGEVLVADDGSRDGTADAAEAAGATVLRLPRRGKGAALSAGERAAPPGRLLVCDADLEGDLRPLLDRDEDLVVARFAARQGGGFGLVKHASRLLIRLLSGYEAAEPLSGQRLLSQHARTACFPLAAGFGCETRMTIDAAQARCTIAEEPLPLAHRPTGRDLRGFLHRGRQLADILLACGPLAVNHRGLRLPLVGWTAALRRDPAVAAIALVGLADDLWSGPERGLREHLRAGRTTGVLKLVAIPAIGLAATRRPSGAILVGLAANALNQLDTKPGRALKAYLVLALPLGAPVRLAVLLLPYDLRGRTMLGDAGSNALGALLGLRSVDRLTGRGRWLAIGALSGLTVLGERRSLGALVERTPGLRELDRLGRGDA